MKFAVYAARTLAVCAVVAVWLAAPVQAAPGDDHQRAARLAAQGTALWQQETDLGAAVDSLRQAVVLDPGNAEYHSTLGRCLLDAGKHAEAESALARALELHPGGWVEAWSRIALGEIHLARAEWERARMQFTRARDMRATSNATREAAGRLEMMTWPRQSTAHLWISAPPGGWASRHLAEIGGRLEDAWSKITGYLNARPPGAVVVFLFDDRQTARRLLDIELGMARPGKRHILLLYGERDRQTDGHELTHVISFYMGPGVTSVTLLREGLAVFLDQSGRNPHQAAANLMAEGGTLGIARLLTQFRACPERAAYAEAGSLVKFLVEKHGLERFRRLWGCDDFTRGLRDIYQLTPEQLEAAWRKHLAESAPPPTKRRRP